MKHRHNLATLLASRSVQYTILLLFLLTLSSCQQHSQDLAGKYQATIPSEKAPLVLLLKNDGKGSWTISNEKIPFSWESRKNEVWLHSKSGGVVVGKLGVDGSIEMSLPGMGGLRFEKVKD